MSKRYRYSLTIATEPNATADESHRALRACLKMMLRSYGIKCLSAVAITAADVPQDEPQRTNEASHDE